MNVRQQPADANTLLTAWAGYAPVLLGSALGLGPQAVAGSGGVAASAHVAVLGALAEAEGAALLAVDCDCQTKHER